VKNSLLLQQGNVPALNRGGTFVYQVTKNPTIRFRDFWSLFTCYPEVLSGTERRDFQRREYL